MAAKIQNARAFQRLLRAFSIQGRMQLFLDDHVVPVAIVEDLSEEAADVRVNAWVFIRVDATAAVGGAAQLTNAGLDSAVDLVIDECRFTAQANTQYTINLTDLSDGALLTGVTTKVWSDTNQLPGVPSGSPDHRDGSAYAAAAFMDNGSLIANEPMTIKPGWTLAPGQKFVVRLATVNVRLQVWIRYRVISRTGRP